MTPTSAPFTPVHACTPARRSMKDSVSQCSKPWRAELLWSALPPRHCRKLQAKQRCTLIRTTRKKWLGRLSALFLMMSFGHLSSQKDTETCFASIGKKKPGKNWRSITRLCNCRCQERHTHEGPRHF